METWKKNKLEYYLVPFNNTLILYSAKLTKVIQDENEKGYIRDNFILTHVWNSDHLFFTGCNNVELSAFLIKLQYLPYMIEGD